MALVLVTDDDPTVREVVADYLTRDGHEVVQAATGDEALRLVDVRTPDLVVLDLMLPGIDGLEVCRRLRRSRPSLPVMMLTALGGEEDRVLGLELGADDYVTKPFSPRELALRVRSILRRSAATTEPAAPGEAPLVDGDLRVDVVAHRVTAGDVELSLTAREYDLLVHLMRNPGRVFSRTELMSEVWGWDYGDLSTVTVHVRRLREKIEDDPSTPVRVMTVWGVGYRWDPTG
jgi:DNA-binding response OmpR family regulator